MGILFLLLFLYCKIYIVSYLFVGKLIFKGCHASFLLEKEKIKQVAIFFATPSGLSKRNLDSEFNNSITMIIASFLLEKENLAFKRKLS